MHAVSEPGVGKELVARDIHARSGRTGEFVAVNCGAIPDSLAEAELFGYEQGAFTGAIEPRRGWFETANIGTLFLDEVGELSLEVQAKLLRVIQEREVVPLGAREAIPLDIRIVAATNVELSRAVDTGRFRRDLFYRLGVVRVEIPPLRSRRADIVPLALHFIEQHCQRLGIAVPALTKEARKQLLENPWRGNVRELDNVIHAALLTSGGTELRAEHFASRSPIAAALHDRSALVIDDLQAQLDLLFHTPPPALLESILAEIVRRALAHCESNQVHAARLLGISRFRLRRLINRFALPGC